MKDYGIFKQLCDNNHYSSLSKMLCSAASTADTKKTIKRITQKHIVYAHMGQLVIQNGICYASFIQNPGNDGEDHDSVTSGVVLAIFSLEAVQSDSFDPETDIAFFPIGGKGDRAAVWQAG